MEAHTASFDADPLVQALQAARGLIGETPRYTNSTKMVQALQAARGLIGETPRYTNSTKIRKKVENNARETQQALQNDLTLKNNEALKLAFEKQMQQIL